MTVAELIEFLEQFTDQGATVQVVEHSTSGSYYEQGGTCRAVDFVPSRHVDYTDLRNNQSYKREERTLLLGELNG